MGNKILSNVFWLVSEKIISIFGLFLVTSAVAKYIGPENFGKLNVSMYYFSFLQALSVWGSDIIGSKLISKYPRFGLNFLRSFNLFKVVFFLLSFLLLSLFFYVDYDSLTFYYSIAVGISSFFAILDIYYIYNEAILKSLTNVIANVFGLTLSLIIRYLIVLYKLDPIFLAVSIVAQGIIPFLIRVYIFNKSQRRNLKLKKINIRFISYGIRTGFGLVISTVSIMIYLNIGRIILSDSNSLSALGVYSVAMVLGSTWSFLNNAVIVSLTPKLYSSNRGNSSEISSSLIFLLIVIGLLYFLFFFFFGHFILNELYGYYYLGAYKISLILILVTILSALGIVSARYIIARGGYAFEAKKAIATAIFSIIITYFFITKYGIYGAALSALLCEILSLTVFNYFFNRCELLKIHLNAFNWKVLKRTYRNIFID